MLIFERKILKIDTVAKKVWSFKHEKKNQAWAIYLHMMCDTYATVPTLRLIRRIISMGASYTSCTWKLVIFLFSTFFTARLLPLVFFSFLLFLSLDFPSSNCFLERVGNEGKKTKKKIDNWMWFTRAIIPGLSRSTRAFFVPPHVIRVSPISSLRFLQRHFYSNVSLFFHAQFSLLSHFLHKEKIRINDGDINCNIMSSRSFIFVIIIQNIAG